MYSLLHAQLASGMAARADTIGAFSSPKSRALDACGGPSLTMVMLGLGHGHELHPAIWFYYKIPSSFSFL
jgi:hypothetical protein